VETPQSQDCQLEIRRLPPPAALFGATLALLSLAGLTLACNMPAGLPGPGLTATPSSSPSPSPIPATPTLTATPTLPPTPTPPPAVRIASGDRALFNGDWQAAYNEYQAAYQNSQDPALQTAALLGLGRTQLQAGEALAAVDTLNALIQGYPQSPNLPQAYFFLGQAYDALGRRSDSAQAYLNYLALRPSLIDAYILDLRGDALYAAGDYASAANDYRAALQSPGFLDTLAIEIKIARMHAKAGDYATALAMYDDIAGRSASDFTKAHLVWLKGQAFTALGQMDQAYAAYQEAVNSYPMAYDSYLALLELVNAGVPVNELNRGIVDYHAGQYGVALAAFDRYLQSATEELPTARYYNGLTLRALGGYEDAIAEWDKVIQNFPDDRFWDDAWEQKAYTQWAFLEQYPPAVETLLGFVSAAPDHSRAGEFLYDAADVAERGGQLSQAAELYQRVATEYPGYEKAQRALYLAGIALYRLDEYANALAIFQRALASATGLDERAAAYLWQGKSQFAAGNLEAAQAAWELAASTDPTGYYSERARDILRGLPPFTPPQAYDLAFDLASERAQAEAWMRATFSLPGEMDLSSLGPLLSDARLVRGNELWALGLYERARAEFEDLRLSVQSEPANCYRLANYFLDLGLYRSAILAARQVLTLAGMDDADTANAPAFFNHVRFGPYFSDLILAAAQQHALHPLFLFSLVRQESFFEGFARSSAEARGLMQIIPSTGQERAANLGWPPDFDPDDLFRPLVNITLGADYLAHWRDRFDGDLYAALAAYNGGPGNAMAWRALAPDDPDLFLEVVRFEETRNYIRGIYEVFTIYRRLYDRSQ